MTKQTEFLSPSWPGQGFLITSSYNLTKYFSFKCTIKITFNTYFWCKEQVVLLWVELFGVCPRTMQIPTHQISVKKSLSWHLQENMNMNYKKEKMATLEGIKKKNNFLRNKTSIPTKKKQIKTTISPTPREIKSICHTHLRQIKIICPPPSK